jgi:hypothetical protein
MNSDQVTDMPARVRPTVRKLLIVGVLVLSSTPAFAAPIMGDTLGGLAGAAFGACMKAVARSLNDPEEWSKNEADNKLMRQAALDHAAEACISVLRQTGGIKGMMNR